MDSKMNTVKLQHLNNEKSKTDLYTLFMSLSLMKTFNL
jgi:hypothetical protein